MYRNIEINVVIFIGAILLVTSVSALLIWGVNTVKDNMLKSKEQFNSSMQEFDDFVQTTQNNTINNTYLNQIKW